MTSLRGKPGRCHSNVSGPTIFLLFMFVSHNLFAVWVCVCCLIWSYVNANRLLPPASIFSHVYVYCVVLYVRLLHFFVVGGYIFSLFWYRLLLDIHPLKWLGLVMFWMGKTGCQPTLQWHYDLWKENLYLLTWILTLITCWIMFWMVNMGCQ